jgi:hypothetical protein
MEIDLPPPHGDTDSCDLYSWESSVASVEPERIVLPIEGHPIFLFPHMTNGIPYYLFFTETAEQGSGPDDSEHYAFEYNRKRLASEFGVLNYGPAVIFTPN